MSIVFSLLVFVSCFEWWSLFPFDLLFFKDQRLRERCSFDFPQTGKRWNWLATASKTPNVNFSHVCMWLVSIELKALFPKRSWCFPPPSTRPRGWITRLRTWLRRLLLSCLGPPINFGGRSSGLRGSGRWSCIYRRCPQEGWYLANRGWGLVWRILACCWRSHLEHPEAISNFFHWLLRRLFIMQKCRPAIVHMRADLWSWEPMSCLFHFAICLQGAVGALRGELECWAGWADWGHLPIDLSLGGAPRSCLDRFSFCWQGCTVASPYSHCRINQSRPCFEASPLTKTKYL